MPKVAQNTLDAFGRAVHRARGLKGWKLKELGAAAGNMGVSFLSDIEKGKRQISPPTVGLLIKALNLDETWIDRFIEADPENETTEQDARADRLLEEAETTGNYARLTEAGISEDAIIALAQTASDNVPDLAAAWTQIQELIPIALRIQEEDRTRSNHPDFIEDVLREAAALARTRDYAKGIDRLTAALKEEQAETKAKQVRLLDRAIDLARLDGDAERAAELIIKKADVETGGRADVETLRAIKIELSDIGRDKGILLEQRIAIALAQAILPRAIGSDEKGAVLNSLGVTLQELGARESGTDRLEDAVFAYKAALEEYTRDRVPLQWAMTQNNLGNALQTLGARESGTGRLEDAVTAYKAALEEWTRDRVPLDWATTQSNLGNALRALGERESGTDRLEDAVSAYKAALEERTRDRVPLQWAATQNNLGNALRALGERESGTDRLEDAVTAYKAALEEWTRDRVPLDWAMTQNNLGTALSTLGERESGTDRLADAVSAYKAALEERTRDRVPLNWAMTQGNLANLEVALFDKTDDPSHLATARAHLANAREVFVEAGALHYLAIADDIAAAIAAREA
ncbi:MAG: helix-turn-helix transcriptional regulator [Pseudomonadota bacterium]